MALCFFHIASYSVSWLNCNFGVITLINFPHSLAHLMFLFPRCSMVFAGSPPSRFLAPTRVVPRTIRVIEPLPASSRLLRGPLRRLSRTGSEANHQVGLFKIRPSSGSLAQAGVRTMANLVRVVQPLMLKGHQKSFNLKPALFQLCCCSMAYVAQLSVWCRFLRVVICFQIIARPDQQILID